MNDQPQYRVTADRYGREPRVWDLHRFDDAALLFSEILVSPGLDDIEKVTLQERNPKTNRMRTTLQYSFRD